MTKLSTNRDIYLAVTELTKSKAEAQPSLEAYLLALRQLGFQFEAYDSISLDDFFSLLRDAFSIQPPQFDGTWVNQYVAYTNDKGFPGWLTTITSQIIDLHEMAESGGLQNELRYFGTQSPRGSHWFNFDPCTYLECAMAGSIGGWEPGDDSGRTYVPGPVAVLDENDKVVTMNPEDVPRQVYPLPTVSWELFRDILHTGQHYE
jgi:hypothetical protein